VLENGWLDTFSASESFHNSRVLIPNVPLNHAFDSFDFVKTMIKSYNLAYELGSFRHQTLVNRPVNSLKSVSEGFLHIAYAMQLSVVRTHHCAVVTEKFFAGVTEVTKRFTMQHAGFWLGHMMVQHRLRAEGAFRWHAHHRVSSVVTARWE